jgi:hypothetical protein
MLYAACPVMIFCSGCNVLTSCPRQQWNDPEYLESLREHATRIGLKEGDVKQIDLIVKPLGSQ